jgi:hypothetical protein
MHEAILDRGDAEGLAFEYFVQIFVPWNVVIVHEPKCHLIAQHEEIGRYLCVHQILKYHSPQKVSQWLDSLNEVMPTSLIYKARSHIMDIDAVASESLVVKARIVTKNGADYIKCQNIIKSIPEQDRWFNDQESVWEIRHPELYRSQFAFIDSALKARELQLKLF